ncbi:hypothetical protein B0H10DRAFT_1954328 [Mycena sp. CBHHK59/15]|nr:hypothetical protein B0H10DRAFT_1954328 [Mycena sp. CBHHK59/15]
MTNWNEYLDGDKEPAVGKLLVDATKDSGVKLIPLAVVYPCFWAGNIPIAFYGLKQQDDGSYLFTLPISGAKKLPLSDTAHDYGLYVQTAIERPELGASSEVHAGRMILFDEIVAQLAQGLAHCLHGFWKENSWDQSSETCSKGSSTADSLAGSCLQVKKYWPESCTGG